MNLVIGVTGSIAAYKSIELVRLLTKQGHAVRVVMTAAAEQFVGALSFQAVTGHPVICPSQLVQYAQSGMDHIELARWADRILIAPASANCLAKLACGLADDPLSELVISTNAAIYLAPAMNQQMWKAPATQRNIETLKTFGMQILGPGSGVQACGDVGPGRMLEPEALLDLLTANKKHTDKPRLKVLISAGPTHEPIDPVRFLSNNSSGKMGFALAAATQAMGADVTLVSGPVQLDTPDGVHRINVTTALEMHDVILEHAPSHAIYVGAAAVSDYRVADQCTSKIKRIADTIDLPLLKNPDILAAVSALIDDRPYCVGFAAETDNLMINANEKLLNKGADMLAANQVGKGLAFGQDTNALTVVWDAGQSVHQFEQMPKDQLARELMNLVIHHFSKMGALQPCKASEVLPG